MVSQVCKQSAEGSTREESAPKISGCWQNSFPYSCTTEGQITYWLSSEGCFQFFERTFTSLPCGPPNMATSSEPPRQHLQSESASKGYYKNIMQSWQQHPIVFAILCWFEASHSDHLLLNWKGLYKGMNTRKQSSPRSVYHSIYVHERYWSTISLSYNASLRFC